MALVAYDYDSASDDDENNGDEEPSSSCVIINKKTPEATTSQASSTNDNLENLNDSENEVSSTTTLFSSLPESKTNNDTNKPILDDKIEDFIPRPKPIVKQDKPKQKVKITIPSLAQFADDDDDEPQAKKIKPSTKGSGLMALLPPVKSSPLTAKSFVPKVVADKGKTAAPPSKSSNLIPNAVKRNAEAKKTEALKKMMKQTSSSSKSDLESDDDDDIAMPETFDDEMWQKVCGRPKPKKVVKEVEEPSPSIEVDIAPEPAKPYDGLDNAAFKELVGKTKRPIGNIKLIDLNEEEIMPEKDLWMTKSLTDPECVPKPVVENPVDPTKRKKHHITYLAQQAKANEQELQSAWASSKNSRMQTRAKYGF